MTKTVRRTLSIASVGLLAFLSSCKEVSVTAADVSSVEIQPGSANLVVGETMDLTARVEDAAGRELRRQVTWTTSNADVATVSSAGKVSAIAAGNAIVRALAEGKSGEAAVSVSARPVASVDVAPPVASITVGDSVRLTATAKASDGTVLPGRPVVWTSSDNGVASVLPLGWVRGVGVGAVTVTATIEGVRGQATVTVQAALLSVAAVRVEPVTATVAAGDTIRFRAIATSSTGVVIPGGTTTWTSGAPSIATVDNTGKATGVAQGSASIVASIDGVSGQATLTVGAATVASIRVTPSSSTLAVGNTLQMIAAVIASDGSTVPNVPIVWTSDNASVVSVNPTGLVIGHALGTATITATGAGKSATATIFVVTQPVSNVTISPTNSGILAGDTLLLTAALTDPNGAVLTGRPVAWSVTDSSVASIQPTGPTTQQARLIALKSGSVIVRATVEARFNETTVTINSRADLVVTKTASAALVKAGDTITFTLQVRNAGPSPAQTVLVTDTLPANATLVTASGGATLSGRVLTWPVTANMASGATVSHTIRMVAGTGALTNVGAATSTTADRNLVNNRATITVNVSPADLAVTKTAQAATVTAGDTIVYTVAVRNVGSGVAGSVVVTDTLPTNASFINATGLPVQSGGALTWPTVGSLGAGASLTYTVRVLAPASGSVVNIAAATTLAGDANPADNRSSVTVTVSPLADVAVTKIASAATVNAGETVSYSIRVRNNGPSAATGVVVRDTLPSNGSLVSGSAGNATQSGNVLTWPTIASLPAGDSATFTLSIVAPVQGAMTNVAAATTSTAESTASNNRSAATTTVSAADLSIAKSGPGTVTPGASVTYTLQATNGGPGRAVSVVVTDTLPPGLTFVSAGAGGTLSGNVVTWPTIQSLNSGALVNYTVTVTAATGTHLNVAAVAGSTADPNLGNNRATATTIAAEADIAVTKTGPASVNAGASIPYAITVTNSGPSAALVVVVQDTLPAGVTFVSATAGGTHAGGVVTWSIGTLSASQSVQLGVDVTAPNGAATLNNVARATSGTFDPDASNNRSPVTTTVIPVANLAVTKSSNPAQVNPGESITYSIGVTNSGPSTASNVVVSDTLPAGVVFVSASSGGVESGGTVTWTTPSLPAAGNLSHTVTVTAPGSAGTLTNVARAASSTTDSDPSNNRATATTTVTQANLAVSKTGPANATVANALVYTITVSNAGPSTAQGVVVHDTLPGNATLVSAVPAPSGQSGNVLTWNVSSIANGANAVFTVTLTPPPSGGSVRNAADASSQTSDPDVSNNHSSATTAVSPAADLSLAMVASTVTPSGGDTVVYSIDIENLGPSVATDVVVTDQLPNNGTFVDATGGATPVGNVITFPAIPTLAVNGKASYTVRVQAPSSGTITNTASVSSPVTDPTSSNNSRTVVGTIASADIDLAMSGPATVGAGASITYTITLTNAGQGTAQGVTLDNTLPNNASVVSINPAPTGGSATVPQWSVGTLAPGDSRVYTIEVTAPLVGKVTNSASALSSTQDSNPFNNDASVTTDVVPLDADLSVTVGASHSAVAVGDTIDYTIQVTNNGPGIAFNVTIEDVLPGNVTYVPGSASSGGAINGSTLTWTVSQLGAGVTMYSFRAVAAAAGTAVNTASAASADSPDPNKADNSASATTTVT